MAPSRHQRDGFSNALAHRLSTALGLPNDAAAAVGALLVDPEGAVSLDDLEAVLRRPIGRLGPSVDRLRRLGMVERGAGQASATMRGTAGLRDLMRRLTAAYHRGGMEAIEAEHWDRSPIG